MDGPLAFPKIDTINLQFTADFYLNLRWNDLRVDFRDLNNRTLLNALDYVDREKLWVPRLGFLNALGPYQTVTDESTTGVLIRQGNPIGEDITLSTEGLLKLIEYAIFVKKIAGRKRPALLDPSHKVRQGGKGSVWDGETYGHF